MSGLVPALPMRPYREGTELVAVSRLEYDESRSAHSDVAELQDALANANAEARRLAGVLAEIADLHRGKHPCPGSGGAGHWSSWAENEVCPTRLAADRPATNGDDRG